jgi:hypothetical protein
MMLRHLVAAAAALIALATVPGAAEAGGSSVHLGVGIGIPCCGPAYYYPPPYYGYYPPPPAYYYPPPAVTYAPPPAAGYAPPPATGYAPPPATGYAPPPATASTDVSALPADAVTLREGRDSNGNYCREYQTTSTVDGNQVQTYGTACLRPDGRWQIIN